jgi:class 3 adenylate cyclase
MDIELAVLFADVVGSTELYRLLGDLHARDIVGTCIDVMSVATQQHQGTVIKTIGDEVMATFPSADDALNAAAQMHQQTASHAQLKTQSRPVAIRIGCHVGPVVLEAGDVFGATVHIAKRVTDEAKGAQVLTTAATVEKVSTGWRTSCRPVGFATLKGVGGEVILFEVLWKKDAEVTSMVRALDLPLRPPRRLRLRTGDSDVLVDNQTRSVTIGRDKANRLVVEGTLISRLHARIDFHLNSFVLVDQSTNGTFVQTAGGEESFVRRDSVQIKGEGMIGLGRLPEQDSPQTIRFACEEP